MKIPGPIVGYADITYIGDTEKWKSLLVQNNVIQSSIRRSRSLSSNVIWIIDCTRKTVVDRISAGLSFTVYRERSCVPVCMMCQCTHCTCSEPLQSAKNMTTLSSDLEIPSSQWSAPSMTQTLKNVAKNYELSKKHVTLCDKKNHAYQLTPSLLVNNQLFKTM